MQVNIEKISPVLVELSVEVGVERVDSEVEKAFRELGRNAKIKGFRPGKAPRTVLNHVFGARVAADVAQRLVDATYPEALGEQKVQPVSQPNFEPQPVSKGKPFSYKARVEIIPEIANVVYEGLEVKRPSVTVSDEDIAKELDGLRRANSTLEAPSEARAARAGDVATIDFEVLVAGKEIEGAGTKDFQVELGSGQLLKEIDEAVVGTKVGGTAKAEIEMPAGHPHPELAGQKATFQIEVRDLKERILPVADDEFAKDLGDFETLDALKEDIKVQLEAQKKEQSENTLAERLVEQLVEKNEVPLPPSLVQQQMRMTEQEILMRARAQGGQVGGLGAELRQQIQKDSEVKVRAGLLMAEIAKKEGIQIGNAEIEEGLKELAEQTGKNIAKLRAEYSDARRREVLVGMILENKVLDIIEKKATIADE